MIFTPGGLYRTKRRVYVYAGNTLMESTAPIISCPEGTIVMSLDKETITNTNVTYYFFASPFGTIYDGYPSEFDIASFLEEIT